MEGVPFELVRCGSATTTLAVRVAIQPSQGSVARLSRELEINLQTVGSDPRGRRLRIWQPARQTLASTILMGGEEAMIVAFRQRTRLLLEDCPDASQPWIPHLTRSALHRPAAARVRLPGIEGTIQSATLRTPPDGFLHSYISELRAFEGKLYLFAGVDCTSKVAIAPMVDKAHGGWRGGSLITPSEPPPRIRTMLTDRDHRRGNPSLTARCVIAGHVNKAFFEQLFLTTFPRCCGAWMLLSSEIRLFGSNCAECSSQNGPS